MYAVFEDGGKQYKVSQGDALLIERRDLDEGQNEIVFDKIMLVGEEDNPRIGTPWVEGATVSAKVVAPIKMPKIVGLKFKRRKGYAKKWGHRQKMLKVEISAINA